MTDAEPDGCKHGHVPPCTQCYDEELEAAALKAEYERGRAERNAEIVAEVERRRADLLGVTAAFKGGQKLAHNNLLDYLRSAPARTTKPEAKEGADR